MNIRQLEFILFQGEWKEYFLEIVVDTVADLESMYCLYTESEGIMTLELILVAQDNPISGKILFQMSHSEAFSKRITWYLDTW